MTLKGFLLAAAAVSAIGAASAKADDTAVGEARTPSVATTPTTPQVQYPPICRWDPLFPRYCRRW